MRMYRWLGAMAGLWMVGCTADEPKETDQDTEVSQVPQEACLADAVAAQTVSLDACDPDTGWFDMDDTDGDGYPACISDDGAYHRIEENVSSIARVEAYEAIGALLWNNPMVPTQADFLKARELLDAEEGLGSRLDRRYDVHYEAPADGSGCDEEGVAAQYPQYCVGPAVLRPAINAAFADVAQGGDPVVNAEIIHAALTWFLYVSPVKEATTCTEKAKDCDSAWAYYTGGRELDDPIGLAAELAAVSAGVHRAVYNGVLAVRCWRDLDAGTTAEDLDLRDRAIGQMDDALLFGVAQLIKARIAALEACSDAASVAAMEAGLDLLLPLFADAVALRDTDAASALPIATDAVTDWSAVVAAIDAAVPCP